MENIFMEFMIQASDPQPSKFVSAEGLSLGEALETIFPLTTEFALLAWNDVYVPLTYKYDISIMIDDVIGMLNKIVSVEDGTATIYWPSNNFSSKWILSWNTSGLSIETVWESVIGGTESLLNRAPYLEIDKNEFLFAWKPLLRKIRGCITAYSGSVDTKFLLVDLEATLDKLPAG
jgi:hypothetical protein